LGSHQREFLGLYAFDKRKENVPKYNCCG